MGIGENSAMRVIRIIGIIAFALIIGYAAYSLFSMYESGSLFETYNNQRADKIALLVISFLSMGVLGYIEVMGSRNEPKHRGFGGRHYREERGEVIEGKQAASIYTAPRTVDPWRGREVESRPISPSKESYEYWLDVVRVFCAVLPLAYMLVSTYVWMSGSPRGQEFWVVPTLFSTLTLLSLVVAIGIFRMKKWGLSLGYLLAIFNLIIFPYGTVVGLLLLIGLVGASPAFESYNVKFRRRATPVSI